MGSNPLGSKYLRINDLGNQGCRTNNIFNNKSIVFREYPLAFAPKFTGPIRTGVLGSEAPKSRGWRCCAAEITSRQWPRATANLWAARARNSRSWVRTKERLDPREYIHAHAEIDYYQVWVGGKVDRYASGCHGFPLYLLGALQQRHQRKEDAKNSLLSGASRYFGKPVKSHLGTNLPT